MAGGRLLQQILKRNFQSHSNVINSISFVLFMVTQI